MKVFNVALIAVLSSIVTPHTLASSMTNNVEWNNDGHSSSSSNGNGGFSTGTSCLQELYSHETPLTCTGPKFWESISMEAPPTCIMGESLDIEKLSLLSTFTTTAYDFSVFVYTGTNYDMSSTLAAINGESCSIQSLTASNKGTGTGNAKIVRDDNDSCWDVVMTGSNGDCKISTTIAFTEIVSIPCTDYGADDGVVKLQLCSSGRTKDDNVSCDDDVSGLSPSGPSMCYCETIAIPGVEIIVNGKEPETPSPTTTEVMVIPAPITDAPITDMPTLAPITPEPTDSPTKAPVTDEPTPAPTDAPITDVPTLAPITPEPTDSPTKAPVTPAPNTQFPTEAVEVVTPGPTPCLDVVANDDSTSTPVDTSVTIPVLINDAPSIPGMELTVTKLLYDGANGKCIISESETGSVVVYLPDSGYFGMDTCVYETCDVEDRCDTATISIVVIASDIVPIAYDDYVTTDKDTPVTITPLVNDTAVTGYPLVVKTITIDGANGTCVVDTESVVIYIPDSEFVGVDTCVYEACDERPMCDTATVTITVTGEPEPCDNGEGKADVPTLEPTALLDVDIRTLVTKTPTPKPTPAPVSTPEPTVIGTNENVEIIPEPTPNPSKKPTKKPTSTPVMDNWGSSAPTPEPTLIEEAKFPEPTYSPVTDEPTDSPTKAPLTSEPTEYPTLEPIELIIPEPTPNPSKKPTKKPTSAPVMDNWGSSAPTPCGYRSYYIITIDSVTKCSNGYDTITDSDSQEMFATLVDCCAKLVDGDIESCKYIDVCNPTPAPVELITPEPTLSPVTDEPTDSPTKAPVTNEPTEYPTPPPEELIVPEPTLSPVTPEPTYSPVTPAPTPCEYRKWYFTYTELSGGAMGAKMCTNGEYSSSIIDSMTYYDSVDDCCAQNFMSDEDGEGGECMKIDVCNPPTEYPTPAPVTPAPVERITPEPTYAPTPEPTYAPITDEPTLAPVTPAPTPCEYRKWYLMYNEIGEKKCTNGYSNPNEEGFSSMVFYDSVGECCAATMSGGKCMTHDVCNPTPPPSEYPTIAPITQLPTFSPTTIEIITYAPITDKPTLSPVTPAPTPCEYRKWYLMYAQLSGGAIGEKKCTNGYSNPNEEGFSSMIFYDSVGECCAANMSGGKCMIHDVCNPTPPPSEYPTPAPVTLAPVELVTPNPTPDPVTDEPTLSPVTPAPTPCEYRKWFLIFNELSGGAIGVKTCTNGYSTPDKEVFYDSVGECCAATMAGGECMQIDICNPTPPPTPTPPVEVTEIPTDIERGSPTLLPTLGPTFAGTPTVGKESESVKLIPRGYRKRMLRYMKL